MCHERSVPLVIGKGVVRLRTIPIRTRDQIRVQFVLRLEAGRRHQLRPNTPRVDIVVARALHVHVDVVSERPQRPVIVVRWHHVVHGCMEQLGHAALLVH